MNSALADILDKWFTRRFGEEGRPETLSEMAEKLGLEKATLSRLRSGKLAVNRWHATRIADRLCKDPREREQLVNVLLEAQPALPDDQRVVSQWFEERAKPDVLMIVEFREPPALTPGTGRTPKPVARAIAKGMSYAMVFPYPNPNPKRKSGTSPERVSEPPEVGLPIALHSFLNLVFTNVKGTYFAILQQVLEIVYAEGVAELEGKRKERAELDLKERLMEAAGRLQLYYLHGDEHCLCPGIGHRMFYIEDHSGDENRVRRESWEWRTVEGADQMVQKLPSPEIELQVAAERFQPIIQFWSDGEVHPARLPANDEEMYNPVNRFASLISETGARGARWVVYRPRNEERGHNEREGREKGDSTSYLEEIVDEFLKMKRRTK